jgi:hypothetical protein
MFASRDRVQATDVQLGANVRRRKQHARAVGVSARLASVFACGWLTLAAACTSETDPPDSPCVTNLPATCDPSLPVTYDALYDKVFEASCGVSGVGCHGATNPQAGLDLSSTEAAYGALLGTAGGRARVLPADPACSILVERLESSDPDKRMPRGATQPLAAGVRCAIETWIKNGAER